ncbi:MAG: carboxypeptidase regulatory-like domain-containing protein [Kofleriaceae bacterium]
MPSSILSTNHVIVATLSRISPFRVVIALALALISACQGDASADGTDRGTASPAGSRAAVANGDVVIATSSTPYTVSATAANGSVTGTVALSKPLDTLPAIETGDLSATCGPNIPDGSVTMQGNGLAGVVVWLDGARTGKAPSIERRVELESDHCKLTPRVQAALKGSAVNIIGHDDFRQHLRFTVAGDTTPRAAILLGGGEQVIPTELPFLAPGLVAVRDAEHPWTRAYLAVFDHPYFTVTGNGGTFTIDGVPAGKYKLNAWHERTGVTTQEVDVADNAPTKVTVTLTAR